MVAYSFKKRFVEPIRVGLGYPPSVEAFAAGMDEFGNVHRPPPKRQTIRAIGKRRHARPGETIQLYTGMRTRQCQAIGVARCVAVIPIRITVREHSIPVALDGAHIGGGRLHDFARADGFAGAEDMLDFWKSEHGLGLFDGVLIRWEPFSQAQLEAADD